MCTNAALAAGAPSIRLSNPRRLYPFYADVYGVRLFDAPAEHYRYGFLGGLASILPTTVSVTLPGSPVVKYPPSETFTARFVSAGNVGSICRPRAG